MKQLGQWCWQKMKWRSRQGHFSSNAVTMLCVVCNRYKCSHTLPCCDSVVENCSKMYWGRAVRALQDLFGWNEREGSVFSVSPSVVALWIQTWDGESLGEERMKRGWREEGTDASNRRRVHKTCCPPQVHEFQGFKSHLKDYSRFLQLRSYQDIFQMLITSSC